jgi:hypothetical protein
MKYISIYITNIILPVLLWPLTPREEPRRGVFENRVLRRIFQSMKIESMGVWIKLHKEEFHDF